MSDAGLKIIVGADVSGAIANVNKLDDTLESLEKELNLIGRAIDAAVAKGADISKLEDAFQKVKDKVAAMKAEIAAPIPPIPVPPIPVPDDKPLLNSLAKQRIAFLDVGRVITGQGFNLRSLASNFSLLGPEIVIAAAALYGLYTILTKQTDAEKKAADEAKRLHDVLQSLKSASDVTETSTGSESGNIARVQALAAAITNSNLSYKERKNALDELRETNKAYFGDLTLETASLKTLTDKVNEYSKALITEAVVKGQVEEIAKVSSELQKQIVVLDKLKDARDRQSENVDKAVVASVGSKDFGPGGAGSSNVYDQEAALARTTTQYLKQNDAVAELKTKISEYTDELNKNIALQIQQKPLQVPPKYTDDLKSIIPILEQIKKIYDDIAKPNKEPIFKLVADSVNQNDINLIQTQIREAIKKGATDGAKDPAVKKAYDDLAVALQAKLTHLQNPNAGSHVQGIVDVKAEGIDTVESKIEKAFGSKGLEIKVPLHLSEAIEDIKSFDSSDVAKIQKGLEKSPSLAHLFVNARADVKLAIGKVLINEADLKKLRETIADVGTGVAVDGLVDIGKAIGDAISGAKNPVGKAIKDFSTVLGDGLITIGKQMILASTAVQAIKTALTTLFGNTGGGIVAGIAAVALGEVVKNVGAKAFATGGIVTGPTNALIGEAGPEVVFPLNQLNRFVKNTQGSPTQNINVTGHLSGNNIRLALARTNKLQGLV